MLDRDHFSLGVVRTPRVRAIFQLGPDWDTARHRILEFIKARESPTTPLCPQWTSSPEQSPRAASTDQRPVLSLKRKNAKISGERERGGGVQGCSVSCLSSPVRNPLLKHLPHTTHGNSVSGGTGLGDFKKCQEHNTSRNSQSRKCILVGKSS